MNAIEDEIEAIKGIINEMRTIFLSSTEEASNAHSLLKSKVFSLNTSLSNSISDIEKIFNRLAEVKSQYESLIQKIGSFVPKESLNDFSEQMKSFKNKIESSVSDASKPGVQALSMIKELTDYHVALGGKIDEQKQSQAQTKSTLREIDQMVQENKKILSNQMQGALEAIRQEIFKRFDALPAPKPSVSSEEVQKIVSDTLEPVTFDAKNATLRSTNTDLKLNLIEKKIEQLMLLAKRFELSK